MLDSILNKFVKILFFIIILISFSCEDAEYELDNIFDPDNMGLDAPALFFHPNDINVELGDTIEIDLYSYKMGPASAAYLKIKYTQGIRLLNVQSDDFFQGDNQPLIHWDLPEEQESYLNIQIYYLPDMNSIQAEGGTWSLAKIQFIAEINRKVYLDYIVAADSSEGENGPYTELRNFNNQPLIINDYGDAEINIE
tara:strand:+ start:2358 stop:2945 length:588 start_codon:yes stop_codon:yes gene_type:complete